MSFKTKGKVLQILPEQKGTSPRGDWKKQDFVIEAADDSQYPKKICFTKRQTRYSKWSSFNGRSSNRFINGFKRVGIIFNYFI